MAGATGHLDCTTDYHTQENNDKKWFGILAKLTVIGYTLVHLEINGLSNAFLIIAKTLIWTQWININISCSLTVEFWTIFAYSSCSSKSQLLLVF